MGAKRFGGRGGILCVVFLLLVPWALFAQDGPAIRSLGARYGRLGGDWLAYTVPETFRGRDLNGDGDMGDAVVHVRNLSTGRTTSLQVAGGFVEWVFPGEWLRFGVSEAGQGEDLNGDGDTEDSIGRLYNPKTGATANLGVSGYGEGALGEWLILHVRESEEGRDLNRDGDTKDTVIHVRNLTRGETTNLELAEDSGRIWVAAGRILFEVSESKQGQDLDGDGETRSIVLHAFDVSTGRVVNSGLAGIVWKVSGEWVVLEVTESRGGEDLNGDGDIEDTIWIGYNAWTGRITRVPLSSTRKFISGDRLVLSVNESNQGEDLDGDGEIAGSVPHACNLSTGEIRNLGHRASLWGIAEHRVIFVVYEPHRGEDLNGDGDRSDHILHIHDLETGETTNRMLPVYQLFDFWAASGDLLVVGVPEPDEGEDLNGDGDIDDVVVHVHNLATGETRNTGLAAKNDDYGDGVAMVVREDWVVLPIPEPVQGRDLNADGDQADEVLVAYNLATGETASPGLAVGDRWGAFVPGGGLYIRVRETGEGKDLNGDGDAVDTVACFYDLATGRTTNTALAADFDLPYGIISPDRVMFAGLEASQGQDLNGDGDAEDYVLHIHDLVTGTTANLGLCAGGGTSMDVSEDWLLLRIYERDEGRDLNRDGDLEDSVLHLVDLTKLDDLRPHFVRGEAGGDGALDLGDGIVILSWLFVDGPAPMCLDAADVDDNGRIDISDAVRVFRLLFVPEEPMPPPPGLSCGPDETEDALDCRLFLPCL
ncbi:MAG: hypothetical protein JXP34_07245 [Planctomycetes bacterium]|nr:hypothetical protein [Planctomycetota bacterium]